MMIYKGNFPYYYAYLQNSINYILMIFSTVHELLTELTAHPSLPHLCR